MIKFIMTNDNSELFDSLIPDITGDGKADLTDGIIFNETIFADDEPVKNKKHHSHSDNIALIISAALATAGILAMIFIFAFLK